MFIHCGFLVYATFKGGVAEFFFLSFFIFLYTTVCGKGDPGCLGSLGVTVGIKGIGCRS
jgi:hypothetical protein